LRGGPAWVGRQRPVKLDDDIEKITEDVRAGVDPWGNFVAGELDLEADATAKPEEVSVPIWEGTPEPAKPAAPVSDRDKRKGVKVKAAPALTDQDKTTYSPVED